MTNNRKIKFRGFHRDENGKEKIFVNGEWIKGYWVYGVPASNYMITTVKAVEYQKNAECAYVSFDYVTIIPETVGQYTGLNDKNGKEIFEGDIVATPKYGVDNGKGQNYSGKDKFVVGYSDGTYMLENGLRRFCLRLDVDAIVCGNIWDNPELLEVK